MKAVASAAPSAAGLDALEAAREAPRAVALVHGGAVTTWDGLAPATRAVASALLARGLEPFSEASTLAWRAGRGPLDVALVHAALRLGLPLVPLHARLTDPEVEEARARLRPRVFLSELSSLARHAPAALPAPPSDAASHPLAILSTSGSAGPPRGVVLTRGAFVASARASALRLPLGAGDRWLLAMPLAHVGGLSIVVRALLSRSAVVLAPDAPFDARVIAAVLARDGVTHVSLVPTMLARLLALQPPFEAPPALRAILLGGDAAPAALRAQAAARGLPVLHTYGLTEACSQVATTRPGEALELDASVGEPLPGIEVCVVGGAIHVRGPTLLRGYAPPSEAPALGPDGFFDTGDLGYLDARGRLHVTGRRTELLVTGGENVSPAEVAEALRALPGVTDACVVGVPDAHWGQRVAAAVVSSALEPSAILAALRGRLAPHKVPKLLRLVPRLPLGPSGKPDRRAVAALFDPAPPCESSALPAPRPRC